MSQSKKIQLSKPVTFFGEVDNQKHFRKTLLFIFKQFQNIKDWSLIKSGACILLTRKILFVHFESNQKSVLWVYLLVLALWGQFPTVQVFWTLLSSFKFDELLFTIVSKIEAIVERYKLLMKSLFEWLNRYYCLTVLKQSWSILIECLKL